MSRDRTSDANADVRGSESVTPLSQLRREAKLSPVDAAYRIHELERRVNRLEAALAGRKMQMHAYRQENEFMKHERARFKERMAQAAENWKRSDARHEAELDEVMRERDNFACELRIAQTNRVETVQGVLDLMRSAWTLEVESDAILPCSNGYGCWFIPNGQIGTASLTADEIVQRIDARTTDIHDDAQASSP